MARARAGEGPTLLEMHTVRLWGHFEGDAQALPRRLARGAESHDPIPAYEAELRAAGLLDDDAVAAVRADAQAQVDAAIAFAKASPCPTRRRPADYVFA